MDLLGFWSYVHADDDVDMGRIVKLANDIVANYEAITAEEIKLFLDADDLHWGDKWRGEVDGALSNVAFFIPVITPRYFTSIECRRELSTFANRAQALGIRELILPILYIDVPELHEETPSDHLVRLVKDFHWVPWTEHRFKERSSGEYRGAVDSVARELVRRVASVERTDVVAAAKEAEASDEDDAGTLDKIAALEEAMPRWARTLEAITKEMQEIGLIVQRGTTDMELGEKQGKGFAARLTVARRIANELNVPVEKIDSLGQEFAADLSEIDAGVRTILEQAEEQVQADPSNLPSYCTFEYSLRNLAKASDEGLDSVEQMIAVAGPLEKMSKDMRTPIRRLRTSLTAMLEAREITRSWVEILDEIDIDCSQVSQLPDEQPM